MPQQLDAVRSNNTLLTDVALATLGPAAETPSRQPDRKTVIMRAHEPQLLPPNSLQIESSTSESTTVEVAVGDLRRGTLTIPDYRLRTHALTSCAFTLGIFCAIGTLGACKSKSGPSETVTKSEAVDANAGKHAAQSSQTEIPPQARATAADLAKMKEIAAKVATLNTECSPPRVRDLSDTCLTTLREGHAESRRLMAELQKLPSSSAGSGWTNLFQAAVRTQDCCTCSSFAGDIESCAEVEQLLKKAAAAIKKAVPYPSD